MNQFRTERDDHFVTTNIDMCLTKQNLIDTIIIYV